MAVESDVGSSESVQQTFAKSLQHFKEPPSLLANCAGIATETYLVNMTEQEFDQIIRVNLKVS